MPRDAPAIGPLLYARGFDAGTGRHALSVLLAVETGEDSPPVRAEGTLCRGRRVDNVGGLDFHRHDMVLPSGATSYAVGETVHPVRLARPETDMRVAFVSCNGQEEGDFDRPADEREAMWTRLAADHAAAPLSLLLHGGDQIYADAALTAHPDLRRWADLPFDRRDEVPATEAAERAVTEVFLDRWRRNVTAPDTARLLAQVPSAAMWDDHDIFDGYGSHPVPVQDSPLGRMIYRVARRFFRLFQAGGHDPADPATLTFALSQPGFVLVAPDLRTERRPDRVMGPAGWAATEAAVAAAPEGEPLFLMSSVPALGPRLSLVEGAHRLVPGAQRYEDDLRDQWQSRAHRDEWRRFLSCAADRANRRGPVTFLSGEIHLAGRAEMATLEGATLHQLVASGISHPPPPVGFARALGLLGSLGEAPLPGHPIRLAPLPGRARRFEAQRNFLLLERRDGAWRARWELEETGPTEWLGLHEARASAGASSTYVAGGRTEAR